VGPVGPVRTLVLETQGNEVLDPRLADSLIVASSVRIRGLLTRTEQEGLGVPMVAYFKKGSDALLGQPGVPLSGMAIPVTAVLTFEKNAAKLAFQRTLVSDSVSVRGKRVQLAADFSAPIAILLSNGRNRSIDVSAFLFTKQKIGTSGLYQFQVYDPNKIPVIFVHGLLSRPEAWTQVLNGLLADPQIRERYQFWFYMYPTGLPVWSSASILRSEMDRFHSVLDPKNRNPDMNKIVLVGHSMGGLISSLLVREGGEQLWRQFSDRSPTSLNFSPNARRQLLNLIYFSPRNDVSRVIFVATPHRGSRLALNPIAGFFSRLVQLPFNVLDQDRQELLGAIRDDMRDLFVAPANSVQFLRAESPLLLSILNLPLSERVTYHSIIGDRGRGNTPNSSDGVVPYWSSHLEGAASEKIVPSGHGANEHPQGVEEIRRILVENLKQKSF
jgi:pimeloyl-ACP methyl ester carboxylesterase